MKTIAQTLLIVVVLMTTTSIALGSGRRGEVHEYCGEAEAIVVGKTVSFSAGEATAEFEVQQWLKRPAAAASQPATTGTDKIRLSGGQPGAGFKGGRTFDGLDIRNGRFLVFVFRGGRTGDGRLGSIIPIPEGGRLSKPLWLGCPDPQPTTEEELVALIRRIMSKRYRDEQIATLGNAKLQDPLRAEAARRLGALFASEAWDALKAQATKPGRDEEEASARASLTAMFRIDEARTTPICLDIVRTSRHDYQVTTAAALLARRPSNHPEVLEILVLVARYWETNARHPADRPLPELIQAMYVMGRNTPDLEQFLLRSIEKGRGNVVVTAMAAAGSLKIRSAVPLICRHLTSLETTVDISRSASLAIALLVQGEFHPFIVNQAVTQDEARQTAADAFSEFRDALLTARTIECCRGDRVVIASAAGGQIYVLVGWQPGPKQGQPVRKAALLYRTSSPA